MSTEYPDVLGDLIDARQRFEVNGVHYVLVLQPGAVAPGKVAELHVWLQSCWDVPVETSIRVSLPPPSPAGLSILQTQTDVPLEAGEVGEVTIPIAVAANLPPGSYPLTVGMAAKFEVRGQYIRSQSGTGHLQDPLLSFTTRLGLTTTQGMAFAARTCLDQQLTLRVEGDPQPQPAADLTPTYLSHWTVADLPIQGKAQKYVNDQRLYIEPKLGRQPLYVALLDESQKRCREAALPLHIGEALFLAKILTYAAERFLRHTDRQDAILVPAYTLAFRYDLPVSDPITLIARADYGRLARLAVSLSFGLLRRHLGRDPWTPEEQLAVAGLIENRLECGGVLPAEFLYLPLLLGGLLIGGDVQMPGENLAQSAALLVKARHQRAAELAENPELIEILEHLLAAPQPPH